MMCAISCFIGPRYNGTRLYMRKGTHFLSFRVMLYPRFCAKPLAKPIPTIPLHFSDNVIQKIKLMI